jgi:hypothetical protein
MELALTAETSWRERFWNKHGQWLEATGLDRPLDEWVEVGRLEQEVEELRRRLATMEEYSPGRELIGAISRTRLVQTPARARYIEARKCLNG